MAGLYRTRRFSRDGGVRDGLPEDITINWLLNGVEDYRYLFLSPISPLILTEINRLPWNLFALEWVWIIFTDFVDWGIIQFLRRLLVRTRDLLRGASESNKGKGWWRRGRKYLSFFHQKLTQNCEKR